MRAHGFWIDDVPAQRFKTKRSHVAQQYAEIDQPDVAAELTRSLRPVARRSVLGIGGRR